MSFHFYQPPFGNPESHRNHLVGTLAHHIHSTRELLASVGRVLGFPPHFGKNFDAFWDCLRDLPPEPKPVALVHQDLPQLHHDDLETYLELLRDAELYWQRHNDEHVFEVWFPESCRKKIEAVLKNIPPPDDEELE